MSPVYLDFLSVNSEGKGRLVAMALALYRRYRPDTFEGVIGQDQVTVPLMRALDEGKLTHAYLFSGPRGCGKTSSARILARCVNCAKGPTSHPCGECESCKDLATGGPGSIDVVEIDAASHNGVDDARELRERAGFAPARDRYKIFILDEAHMVTQQGFNALLKIVEEPPEHVMFIFATTEPDKVIGTIRSRTHHYPFRLVPQEVMGPYLEMICDKEGIKPEPGVLKLAMRAGGGSMRDTLSVLDQLMVGSVEGVITHDAAVALLGFTPEALIGEAVDAVINHNGEALYGVIQKVVVGGFDPRRFVEDLLARVRDLLVLTLAGDRAESVLSDTAEAEDMDDLHRQAKALGLGALTAMADIINTTLGAMTGAISPRMRLELLAARLLAGSESGFATAVPAPVASGMPPAAASSTTSAASGVGASGFAGSSRGGFAGASHGGFSGAARNQQAAAPQSTASHESVGGNGPVNGPVSDRPAGSPSVQPAVATAAANAGWGAPAASPAAPTQPVASPAASDNRSIDEKWDAAVAALPETIREYVSRDKVPTVKFGPNRKGLPCLSMTFDKSLSQHAFALAVDNSGKKAAAVVMDAVRNEFGANAVIAPSAVAANGERVESVKRMSPEQLAKVKQQIAMAKAGLAASSLGAGLGIHMGSEPKAPKLAATGQAEDTDDSHRADQSGASTAAKSWSNDDPWAKPAVSNASPQSADGFAPNEPATTPAPEEHHKKHVAVPDISDGVDPWAAPTAPVAPAASVASAGPTEQSTGQPATASSATAAAGASDDPWNQTQSQAAVSPASQLAEADPWNQPYQQSPHDDPWNQPQGNHAQAAPQATPHGDPWNQSQSQTPASSVPQTVSGNMSGDDPWSQPQSVPQPAASDDPWNQPQPAQPTPNADPWNSQPQPQPQVAAEDDEYSMNDQSLGEATAMNLDDLKKLFEVKKVEQFAADDPKNPKNIQPAKKHSDE